MSSNIYPKDELGNELRIGQLVHLTLNSPNIICTVADVQPASDLRDDSGSLINMQGQIVLQTVVPLPYGSFDPRLRGVLALRVPDSSGIKLVTSDSPERPQ